MKDKIEFIIIIDIDDAVDKIDQIGIKAEENKKSFGNLFASNVSSGIKSFIRTQVTSLFSKLVNDLLTKKKTRTRVRSIGGGSQINQAGPPRDRGPRNT